MNIERIEEIIEEYNAEGPVVLEITGGFEKIFGSFYNSPVAYFLARADKLLEETSGSFLINGAESILPHCAKSLVEDIIQAVISTLIVELYKRKEEGVYSSEDIYCDFCDDLKNTAVLRELAREYPCMFSLMYELSEKRAVLIASCVENIACNKTAIEKTLGFEFERITDIGVTNGDSHNDGKKVIIITTDNGHFVYKPHSLAPEMLFGEIISDIVAEDALKYDLKTTAVCSFDDFGIQEFITQKPVSSEEEAKRYFYRVGAFSAVFDALNCEDLHHENIICSGEYPYFVDLETLVKNPVDQKKSFEKNGFLGQVVGALGNSVLGTMLYPFNTNVSFFDMDLAGITGSSRERSSKWKTFELTDAGTDRMRFIRIDGQPSEANNLLICNGKEVSAGCFTDELAEGYKEAMAVVKLRRNGISERICKSRAVIRRVLRPTAFYGKLLKVSYSPAYFGSEEARYKLFSKLFKGFENNEKECERIKSEIKALMRNDIPLFNQNICSRDLVSDGVTVATDYSPICPCDSVAEKFERIDDAYIRSQLSYIRMSMSTNYRKDDDRETFGRSHPLERLLLGNDFLKGAEAIAEHICETMIQSLDDKSTVWYTVCQHEKYLMEICDTKLYDGGGIPLFLLALWKCTGNRKWLDIAEKTLNGMKELGFIKHIEDGSLFIGTTGVIYLFYCFYAFTGDESYRERLEEYSAKVLEKISEFEFGTDVINGLAGSVTALTGICRKLPVASVKRILEINAQALAEKAEKDSLPEMTGFAHGYAGISLALATYGDYSGDRRFIGLAEKLVERENLYASQENGNWRDLRKAEGYENTDAYGNFWCHGAPGIALSRLLIRDIIGTDVERDIEWGRKCLVEKGFSQDMDHSLCHGVFGSIDMLITFGRMLGDNSLIETATENALAFMEDITQNGFRAGLPSLPATPSFMIGITGVGYELLRVYDNSLPSVNAIEVPELRRKNIDS